MVSASEPLAGGVAETYALGKHSHVMPHVVLDPGGTLNIGLAVIIEAQTGVTYEQQCGGYSTEQRTREIGVRLALGSPRSVVVLLIVREMALIACIAAAIALPAVVGLARLFQSELFGVTTFDPLTLFAAVILTVLMLSVAAALPARRAAAVEPMQALRTE